MTKPSIEEMTDELYDDEAEVIIQIAIKDPSSIVTCLRRYGVFDNVDDETIEEQYYHRFGEDCDKREDNQNDLT